MKSLKDRFENLNFQEALIEIVPIIFTLGVGLAAITANYMG
jgi:hypothetical protein